MSNSQEQNDKNASDSTDNQPSESNAAVDTAPSQPSAPIDNANQDNTSVSSNPPKSRSQSQPQSNRTPQQQQYAQMMRDQQVARIYAQQHYMQQQQQRQQYAAYYQALIKQRQQQSYHHYYQQIAQQYGYPAMIQAINQQVASHPHSLTRNLPPLPHASVSSLAYPNTNYTMPMSMHMNMAQNMQNINMNSSQSHHEPERSSNGSIILSCEEQPGLMASYDSQKPRKRGRGKGRRKRRRKMLSSDDENDTSRSTSSGYGNQTVSLDIVEDDDMLLGLDKDAFDKNTLINKNEYLPDIKTEFDEWLYFSKKLWQRQKKYKNFINQNRNRQIANQKHNYYHEPNRKRQKISSGSVTRRETIDLSDTISTTGDDPNNGFVDLHLKSAFMSDRALRKSNVLKNKRVISVMINMGLCPPFNEMPKYRKWKKCHKLNTMTTI